MADPMPEIDPAKAEEVKQFTNQVISWFNQAYYFDRSRTWGSTQWMGVPVHKCPTDLWVYQEILFETRPNLIIETGTASGGSALFLAQVGAMLGGIRVVTVDLHNSRSAERLPIHPNITYLTGSSTDPAIVASVRSHIRPGDRVMVALDSDHSQVHVRAELETYALMVSSGCYLVVEDTNVNGHPVYPLHGPGPWEAVAEWLPGHPEFEVDQRRERLMLTFNPGGYLKRK
jgi:cephalosporin hydroxylase